MIFLETAKGWRQAAVSKHAPAPILIRRPAVIATDGRGLTASPVGWSGVAYGDQAPEGECRLGPVIGLMSSTLGGPRHILQLTSKFTRQLDERSLAREVYPPSDKIDRLAFLRELYALSGDVSPGAIGAEDCESRFTHIRDNEAIAGEYPACRFLGIQQASGDNGLGNVYRLLVMARPEAGLAEVKSDMASLLRMLHSGTFRPGALRPKRGAPFEENGRR